MRPDASNPFPRPIDRILRLCLPLALVWLMATSIDQIARETASFWNDARLAPTIGLTKGYSLYYPADDGPVLNTIYPPVTALSYLPAAMAHTPTGALLMAATLSLFYYSVPVLVLCLVFARRLDGSSGLWTALALFVTFMWLTTTILPLRLAATSVHADAPMLGLSGLAIACLARRPDRTSTPMVVASGCLMACAVFAKQTAVLIALAPIVCLGLTSSRVLAARYTLALVAAIAVLGIACLYLFGLESMTFNIVQIPSRHPFYQEINRGSSGLVGKLLSLVGSALRLINTTVPVLMGLAFALILKTMRPADHTIRGKDWASPPGWALLLLACLFAVPTSVLSGAK